MARRGEALTDHILLAAKEVFLDTGFERATMDAVAARAGASKRTLYAHFGSKDKLFLSLVALVRDLFLTRIGQPGQAGDPDDPVSATTAFCARYVHALHYRTQIEMCRTVIAESARFPDAATSHHDLLFVEPKSLLSNYLQTTTSTDHAVIEATVDLLFARLLNPWLLRALYSLEDLPATLDSDPLRTEIREPVSAAVNALVAPLI